MFDGVFNDLIKDKTNSDKGLTPISIGYDDKTPVQQNKPNSKITDPRPDLKDSILWWQMLAAAQDRDPSGDLYAALLYMRTRGTVLRRVQNKDGKFVYVLRPWIDRTGRDGWVSVNEYEAEKHKVLDPVRDRLIELLKVM
jgi:hypothetical protein